MRASTLLRREFELSGLRPSYRARIDDALGRVGVETTPSLFECTMDTMIGFALSDEPITSDQLPGQMHTYLAHNWTGSGSGGPFGQWLHCLKETPRYGRQFIWFESAVAGIATFAGWIRNPSGTYEGWASLLKLSNPVTRETLLADRRTRSRFDQRGIRAFQGNKPMKVDGRLASAIVELAGSLQATEMPLDDPDYSEEEILFTGLHGLAPEASIEAAVVSNSRLWRKLGFPEAPRRQRVLGSAGRVDLIAGHVIGEAKRAVTLNDGPDQIERYLRHLHRVEGRPRAKLRGVLLQCADDTSEEIERRLSASDYAIELWCLPDDKHLKLRQLV
jgi:hypothetical protein